MKTSKILVLTAILAVMAVGLPTEAFAEKYLHINKNELTLSVMEGDSVLAVYPVCAGKNYGQKKRRGDHKTPEGTFSIISIEDSSDWGKNSVDGQGIYDSAYGPWFFRLKCPQSRHIGIHGTRFPESIGTRDSFGCIRLHNEDLLKLYEEVFVGMKVIIDPDDPQQPAEIEQSEQQEQPE